MLDSWGSKAKGVLEEYLADVMIETWTKDSYSNDIDGLIVNLGTHHTEERLSRHFPNLKFIASCTTGLDHIDTRYCEEKGIKVISLQGETDFLKDVHATAEHTWALILSLIRKVPWAFDDVKHGNWDREKWQGAELFNKTLGLVGFGRVAKQVCNIAMSFGMKTLWVDKETYSQGIGNEIGERPVFEALNYLLPHSDIVSIHLPLTEATKDMFNFNKFSIMKNAAYLINTSRGQIVNTNNLLFALKTGVIAGAAIDVIDGEPNIPPVLLDYAKTHSNILLTPHLGGNTQESRAKTQCFIADRIVDYIKSNFVG